MQRTLLILAATLSLAACSTTRLTEGANGAAGANGAGGDSSVASVSTDDGSASRGGPQNVASVIHFDFNSYVVRPDARPVVEGHAAFLNSHAASRVRLEGHTDAVGGREYNLALGQKRAEAARRALNLLGVPDTQIEAVSFGKERPVVPNVGADERNRRVEFDYNYTK